MAAVRSLVEDAAKAARLEAHIGSLPGGKVSLQHSFTDDEVSLIGRVIEDCARCVVCSTVEASHVKFCCTRMAKADASWRSRHGALQRWTLQDFGVAAHAVALDEYRPAVRAVTSLDASTSTIPRSLVELVLAVRDAVDDSYRRHCSRSSEKPLAADDYLPIFAFVVSRSRVNRLRGLLDYLRETVPMEGEGGYFFCILDGAVSYVVGVDLDAGEGERDISLRRELEKVNGLSVSKFSSLQSGAFSKKAKSATETKARMRRMTKMKSVTRGSTGSSLSLPS